MDVVRTGSVVLRRGNTRVHCDLVMNLELDWCLIGKKIGSVPL
jgi:hypothetical protein